MKLFAPEYYKDFKCIADRCRHSCCIGWEIDVDGDTMEKYRSLKGEYGKEIIESIDESETPHFRLVAKERCPHLDEKGLCKIITELGEGYLCHICREHPRFYNDTPYGKDVGLGMACEEACRLILSSDGYNDISEVGEIEGDEEYFEFDPIMQRERIYSVLSDRSVPYTSRLERIADRYGVSPRDVPDAEWREIIGGLEYLDGKHRELFLGYSSENNPVGSSEEKLERALAYFIYRHCSPAWDEEEFRAALGFSLFCERLLASVSDCGADIFECARIISEEIEYSEENTARIKEIFI